MQQCRYPLLRLRLCKRCIRIRIRILNPFSSIPVWCIHYCVRVQVSDVFAFLFTFQSVYVSIDNAQCIVHLISALLKPVCGLQEAGHRGLRQPNRQGAHTVEHTGTLGHCQLYIQRAQSTRQGPTGALNSVCTEGTGNQPGGCGWGRGWAQRAQTDRGHTQWGTLGNVNYECRGHRQSVRQGPAGTLSSVYTEGTGMKSGVVRG